MEGSSSIAKKLKVPPIIIGLTIVAMGTSLPETAVSVTASLVQNNELAVSNVVGSNIFNLMFVIGVCSILTPIMVQKATVVRDIPLSLGCALFLLVLGVSGLGDKAGNDAGSCRWSYFPDRVCRIYFHNGTKRNESPCCRTEG